MDARQGSQTGGFENGRAKDLGSRALSTEAKVTISRQDKTGYRWLGVWVLRSRPKLSAACTKRVYEVD
ncbi:hypothetical protein CGCF413_v011430 [Colletotrichum fructicola]|nr:hypothetical protein CGCF413_v011430 [Colletotrichum fructicola]